MYGLLWFAKPSAAENGVDQPDLVDRAGCLPKDSHGEDSIAAADRLHSADGEQFGGEFLAVETKRVLSMKINQKRKGRLNVKVPVNRKQIVGLNRYLVLLFCAMLASAMFVQAVNIGSILEIYVPLQLQGCSWIFGRWDASTFYCQNGTNGLTTTGVFATLWNTNVETGDLIRLMPENFTVTAALNTPTGVTIIGGGRSSIGASPSGGTVLTLEYDGNVFVASGNPSQGVTIRDLTINGQRHQRAAGTAIYGKFRNLLVDNVFIMDMDTDGITIEDVADYVDCWDTHILNCHIWWIDEYGVRAGARATDMTVEGGHIAYCDIAGFYTTVGGHKLMGVTLDCSHYNVYIYGGSARLEGCNLDQAHRYNVYIQSISGDGSNAISISGGKISKASVETDNTYSQIYIQGYGTGDTNAARDIIITGAQFLKGGAGAGQSKYCVEFAEINERDITIYGNDFRWGFQTDVFNALPISSTIYINEGYLGLLGDCPVVTSGTFTLTSDVTEHTIVELTPTAITRIYNFWLDLHTLTQNCTLRVYSKIDGTNYREMLSMRLADLPAEYAEGLVLKEQMIDTAWKLTIQSSIAEGASRSIPYRYFTEVFA